MNQMVTSMGGASDPDRLLLLAHTDLKVRSHVLDRLGNAIFGPFFKLCEFACSGAYRPEDCGRQALFGRIWLDDVKALVTTAITGRQH